MSNTQDSTANEPWIPTGYIPIVAGSLILGMGLGHVIGVIPGLEVGASVFLIVFGAGHHFAYLIRKAK